MSKITASLRQITDFFAGLNSLRLKIAKIIGIIGFDTILLFLLVLLISAGYNLLGIKKGRASFVISLITADFLWIGVKRTLDPKSFSFLLDLIKSNMVLLIPLILVASFGFLWPKISIGLKKILMKIRSIFSKEKKTISYQEMMQQILLIKKLTLNIEEELLKNISNDVKRDKIILSKEIKLKLEKMNRIFSLIK